MSAAGFNMEDQVQNTQVFRYLSSGEAYSRIFGYDLTKSSVGCTRLPVHLPGMDWVGEETDGSSTSKLLDYFARPPALHDLLYLDYFGRHNVTKEKAKASEIAAGAGGQLVKVRRGCDYYVDGNNKKVSVRSGGRLHVARMYTVSVTQGEQYYLRCLLACVPATSFTDLLTLGSTTYATFRC